jgi:hypothetical protein
MAETPPVEPVPNGVLDLVVGALWGRATYGLVASRGLGRAFSAVAVFLLIVSAVLGVQQYLYLGSQIAAARDSALWLMPRVNIEDGVAEMEGAAPRVLATDRFVVVLDTREGPDIEKAEVGDTRTRFVVLRRALVVFSFGKPFGSALPFDQVTAALGPVSVDGPELIDALNRGRPKMVLAVTLLRAVLVLGLVLVGAPLAAFVYRAVFFARQRLLPAPEMRAVAALAGVPAVGVWGLAKGVGIGDVMALGILVLVGTTVFFVVAAGIDAAESPQS